MCDVQIEGKGEGLENGADENRGFLAGTFDGSPIPWADFHVPAVEVSAPAGGALSGSLIDVNWTVGNQGIALTNSGDWFDQVYLERLDGSGRVKLGRVNHLGFLAHGDSYQIRSASCRERVCTTRYISGVGVSIKTKKKNIK